MTVGASKPFFGKKYPGEALVAERFPPLSRRLKDLPRSALSNEIGKGYRPPYIVTYPQQRDTIVLAELLSRGPLSDAEVFQIVVGTFDQAANGLVVNARIQALLGVLQERKELNLYSAVFEKLCAGAKRDGGLQDYALSSLYGSMALNRIDFSQAALAFLQRDQFVRTSLFYLERNACGAKTVQALSEITVRLEFEKDKQDALRQMKARCK